MNERMRVRRGAAIGAAVALGAGVLFFWPELPRGGMKVGAAPRALPRGEPRLDAGRLARLVRIAAGNSTTALVLVQDGKTVLERYHRDYPGAPLIAMSASKSVLALAVGMLVADGKLKLETTLGSVLPELAGTPKEGVTVLQLLNHTSGLHPDRYDMHGGTIRKRARDTMVLFEPGTCFQYNNNAVDLLAAVAQVACGRKLGDYMEERLFRKLDCVGAGWMTDPDGVPRGAGELAIRPVDLAKLGQLMLDDGVWRGERILPPGWVARSVAPGQPYCANVGLLWWREGAFDYALRECTLAQWRKAGVPEPLLAAARPLVDRKFGTSESFRLALRTAVGDRPFAELEAKLRPQPHVPWALRVEAGPARGYAARGWLGQYLVVLPEAKLVAVRMRGGMDAQDVNDMAAGWHAFGEEVFRLVAP